jgi:hypothetical protein
MLHQFPQNSRRLRRQNQQHFPPVSILALSPHIPGSSQAVQQLHPAVVFNLQPLRQLAHIRTHPGRHSLNGQKHLVLPRLETNGARRYLPGMQVAADLMANFSQALIFTQGE